MQSDTANSPGGHIKSVDSEEEYRETLRQQMGEIFDHGGVIAIIDWCNEVDEKIKATQRMYKIDMLDILQEELVAFFFKKYPPFGVDRVSSKSPRRQFVASRR